MEVYDSTTKNSVKYRKLAVRQELTDCDEAECLQLANLHKQSSTIIHSDILPWFTAVK